MRRPLFTIPWINVVVGLEDLFVIAVLILGYCWAQNRVTKISGQLAALHGAVSAFPLAIVNHELEQSERDGEIKGQLEFLRRQNVQIIQEITQEYRSKSVQ